MKPPDERQLVVLLEELSELLAVITAGAPAGSERGWAPSAATVLEWARRASRDGYPTSSLGGSGAGPSWSVEGEDGNVESIPVTSVEAAADVDAQGVEDPVRRAAMDVVRLLQGALGNLRVAEGQLRRVAKLRAGEPEPSVDDMWCAVHLRFGMTEPKDPRRPNTSRCRWCYDFWLANGQDAPRRLLELRAQGKTITQKVVEETLGRRSRRVS